MQGSEFRVQGPGFRVQGSGFRVQGSGFRVQGAGSRVQGAGSREQGLGFRVQGFEVQGCRLRVSMFEMLREFRVWDFTARDGEGRVGAEAVPGEHYACMRVAG